MPSPTEPIPQTSETVIDVGDALDGLSTEEVKVFQRITSWSSAQIANEHRSLIRLVGKVRSKLEAHVDAIRDDAAQGWMPPMEWTAAYKTTVDGGAKLIGEWWKREKNNTNMGLTDEQLEVELQKAALALVESLPLDDLSRIVRRRTYVETRGDERPPKGERFAQNAHLLKGAK